jgi:molecular chaperone DnaJ
MMGGGFGMQTTCQACGGEGSSIPPGCGCPACNSMGKVRERKTVQVTIPPGVDQNSRIRVSGEGDAPLKGKGPNGDLFVSLNVSQNKDKITELTLMKICDVDPTIQDIPQTRL